MTTASNSPQPPVPEGPAEVAEHIAILLLEAGQRFLEKAEGVMEEADVRPRDYYLQRTQAVLAEMDRRLNHAQGGELVDNLIRLYAWWGKEITEGGRTADADRLRQVRRQMGDIRQAWEHVLFKGQGFSELPRG